MVNIIKYKSIPFTISGLLVLGSFVSVMLFGLKPGIDFTGGSLLELSFSQDRPSVTEVQSTLKPMNLASLVVQPVNDSNLSLKTPFISEDQHQQILSALRQAYETNDRKVLEQRFQTIGPSISTQLKNRAWRAGIAVIIGIIAFIAYSFRKVSRPVKSWKYGLAAVIALVHDVGITVGVFSILGKVFGIEVDISFVVALLTVLGYSVNDTIVVFDRTRENLIKYGGSDFTAIVNRAVNETFARSVNSSLTPLIAMVALYFFGGETIRYFALTLIVGIGFGTYSSIFIASPLLVVFEEWQRRKRA